MAIEEQLIRDGFTQDPDQNTEFRKHVYKELGNLHGRIIDIIQWIDRIQKANGNQYVHFEGSVGIRNIEQKEMGIRKS